MYLRTCISISSCPWFSCWWFGFGGGVEFLFGGYYLGYMGCCIGVLFVFVSLGWGVHCPLGWPLFFPSFVASLILLIIEFAN
jgi:hypothetical protein